MVLPTLLFCVYAHASGAAPVADAGFGVLAYPGDTVVLNGTASSDPEGDSLTYTWTQIDGATVEMDKHATPEPSFVLPAAGPYRFQLVVNDGTSDSAPSEVRFYAPDRSAMPDGNTGCNAVSTSGHLPIPSCLMASLGLLASVGLVRRRRR